MSIRRDVILGLGASLAAVLGTANLGIVALARRRHELRPLDGAAVGGPVDGLPATSTLRCTAGTVTTPQMEGPFYTPNAPQRRDIRDFGVAGRPLVVRGRVLDSRCQPIAGAILDFWQTGHDGVYDQHGYRYRGYQYADSAGRFELVTVRPHAYTAMSAFRTPHIHVKAQGRNTALLTTQLYIPDAQETNARDGLYDPSLEIAYADSDGTLQLGMFDFVLATI
jgi:protocatechuate 3,4-dioxygenase beta subunit